MLGIRQSWVTVACIVTRRLSLPTIISRILSLSCGHGTGALALQGQMLSVLYYVDVGFQETTVIIVLPDKASLPPPPSLA